IGRDRAARAGSAIQRVGGGKAVETHRLLLGKRGWQFSGVRKKWQFASRPGGRKARTGQAGGAFGVATLSRRYTGCAWSAGTASPRCQAKVARLSRSWAWGSMALSLAQGVRAMRAP